MKRRTALQTGSLALLLGVQHLARGATILAVRVWPAPEYSRVTIESDGELKAKQFFVTTPPRLAVDLEGIDLNPALRELVAKVRPDDPNIAGIRVGQSTPGVVRLVVDLKQAIAPQVFSLPPIAAYKHRLVFDLYPTAVVDPLEALINERLKELNASEGARKASDEGLARSGGASHDPLGDLIAQKSSKGSAATLQDPEPAAGGAPAKTQNATNTIANNSTPTGTSGQFDSLTAGPGAKTDRLVIIALDPGRHPHGFRQGRTQHHLPGPRRRRPGPPLNGPWTRR